MEWNRLCEEMTEKKRSGSGGKEKRGARETYMKEDERSNEVKEDRGG